MIIRHFLIDFENVHEGGLNGFSALSANDHVYLFYTKNASLINLRVLVDVIESGIRAHFSAYEIASGKQSLDMQLVSFLGSLIGSEQDSNHRYIIVSRDADYRNTIAFWNGMGINRIEMVPSIERYIQPEPAVLSVPNEQCDAKSPAPAAEKIISPEKPAQAEKVSPTGKGCSAGKNSPTDKAVSAGKISGSNKGTLNNAVQHVLSKKKTGGTKISHVASVAVKYIDKENGRDLIFNDLVHRYGSAEGTALFGLIEPLL